MDEKDELTGLIDFEGASGGDPVADFTHWHFMYRKQLPLEWLMAGYSGESMSRDFPQRLRRNSILKSLFMLPYYHKMQNLNGIRIIKENLEYDLVSKTTS
ncbi:MAG: hypothetical protein UZ21_OP11001000145 [Microgenomates bacterium OLB22]|nr:MAG: hypothetical protein UZ21_OP11001000145 [Microgenomates bacterium OLB22]